MIRMILSIPIFIIGVVMALGLCFAIVNSFPEEITSRAFLLLSLGVVTGIFIGATIQSLTENMSRALQVIDETPPREL